MGNQNQAEADEVDAESRYDIDADRQAKILLVLSVVETTTTAKHTTFSTIWTGWVFYYSFIQVLFVKYRTMSMCIFDEMGL